MVPEPSPYAATYAARYDLFYGDKPYEEEVDYLVACLERLGRPAPARVLEIACGTAGHAIPLARRGYRVVATDRSDAMLDIARAKARAAGVVIDFARQDMTTLDLHPIRFDAVLCLFDSIGYAGGDEAIGRTLRGIADHLVPGGPLILEFWHAPAMLSRAEPRRERRWDTPAGEVIRVSRTHVDAVARSATVDYTLREPDGMGGTRTSEERHVNRYFDLHEMATLLETAGLVPVSWHGGFAGAPVTEESWHVVSVSRLG